MADNKLYFGDNLDILRKGYIADGSVDLIYLDPPFNSKADYNVLYREKSGLAPFAQIKAFTDTWHWSDFAEATYNELITSSTPKVSETIQALRKIVGVRTGRNDMMAYLVMMAVRLIELRRVLKPTGGIYLHCDPTASHYLKVLLDAIFGPENFRNEIIWKRTSGHSDARRYGRVHDILLFYVKSDAATWNDLYQPYDQEYVDQYYRYKDANGRRFMSGDLGAAGLQGGGYEYEWKGVRRIWRVPIDTMRRLDSEGRVFYTRNRVPRMKRYLDEAKGMPVQDVWTDVEALRSWHNEKLGYETQKPLALVERLIQTSSNEADLVLDPFCGCGTAVVAAQKLKRRWIGIDVTHLAVALMKYRLRSVFGDDVSYDVHGEPVDTESARALAQQDRYQFQYWALSLIQARPEPKDEKKGADRGIDGVIYLLEGKGAARPVIIQVKSGNVARGDVGNLIGAVSNNSAAMGLFITLEPPTGPMKLEATTAGFYKFPLNGREYPKIQIRTIEELLLGKGFDLPLRPIQFKQAERYVEAAENVSLFDAEPSADAARKIAEEPGSYKSADSTGSSRRRK